MKLTINELKSLCKTIITQAQSNGYEAIDTNGKMVDGYWEISLDEAHDFIKLPKPVLGDLKRDWFELQALLSKGRLANQDDLERLGNVVKIVAEFLYDPDKPWFMAGGNKLLMVKRRCEANVRRLETQLSGFSQKPRLKDPVGFLSGITPEMRQIRVNERISDLVIQLRSLKFKIRILDLLEKELGK